MTKLFFQNLGTGMYGKSLAAFARHEGSDPSPTKLSSGDTVGLFQSGGDIEMVADGVVFRASEQEIVVSFNDYFDCESLKQPLSLVMVAN